MITPSITPFLLHGGKARKDESNMRCESNNKVFIWDCKYSFIWRLKAGVQFVHFERRVFASASSLVGFLVCKGRLASVRPSYRCTCSHGLH